MNLVDVRSESQLSVLMMGSSFLDRIPVIVVNSASFDLPQTELYFLLVHCFQYRLHNLTEKQVETIFR